MRLDSQTLTAPTKNGTPTATLVWRSVLGGELGSKSPGREHQRGRETDNKQVQRGKNEKDFEKRVKECLKLLRGKKIGAGDAPRSDVER
ncbi:hypothetical protein H5410_019329 [Solanum commersonii]|uniref:Uncharacterized protein n=1 Tax=Solanum commersonii TaxID=4109 RepID=A0A9J5Z7Z2_SOLCO|nr:hypothetical protein H5410_019329 [Solanum commersonii]